jgi:hypothetical protein
MTLIRDKGDQFARPCEEKRWRKKIQEKIVLSICRRKYRSWWFFFLVYAKKWINPSTRIFFLPAPHHHLIKPRLCNAADCGLGGNFYAAIQKARQQSRLG